MHSAIVCVFHDFFYMCGTTRNWTQGLSTTKLCSLFILGVNLIKLLRLALSLWPFCLSLLSSCDFRMYHSTQHILCFCLGMGSTEEAWVVKVKEWLKEGSRSVIQCRWEGQEVLGWVTSTRPFVCWKTHAHLFAWLRIDIHRKIKF